MTRELICLIQDCVKTDLVSQFDSSTRIFLYTCRLLLFIHKSCTIITVTLIHGKETYYRFYCDSLNDIVFWTKWKFCDVLCGSILVDNNDIMLPIIINISYIIIFWIFSLPTCTLLLLAGHLAL